MANRGAVAAMAVTCAVCMVMTVAGGPAVLDPRAMDQVDPRIAAALQMELGGDSNPGANLMRFRAADDKDQGVLSNRNEDTNAAATGAAQGAGKDSDSGVAITEDEKKMLAARKAAMAQASLALKEATSAQKDQERLQKQENAPQPQPDSAPSKEEMQQLSEVARGTRGGIVNPASDTRECSGFGKLSAKTGKCECDSKHSGFNCALRNLDNHEYGRYVGQVQCQHGAAVDNKCVCDDGWEGYHCHRQQCIHGKWACPRGSDYCVKPECICEAGWAGPACKKNATLLPKGHAAKMEAHKHRCPPGRTGKNCDKCIKEQCPKGFIQDPATCKCVCTMMEKCANTGVFDAEKCACTCSKPWTGATCEKCLPRYCPNGMVQDPNSCGCMCPADKKCLNDGVLDPDTCGCNCTGAWSGDTCATCKPQDCNGHGIFDPNICSCECDGPWEPESNCATCGTLDCQHGAFNAQNCSCTCDGFWKGEECDECPSEAERALVGIDCGGRGWDNRNCKCNDECEPISCAHGGKQNEKTCKCDCNIEDAGPAPGGEAENANATNAEQEDAGANSTDAATGGAGANSAQNGTDTTDEEPGAGEISFLETFMSMFSRSATGDAESDDGATGGTDEEEEGDKPGKTYWGGDTCEVCTVPSPSPCKGGHKFSMERCMCSKDCDQNIKCQNHGVVNKESCTCDCPPEWAGERCEKKADGLTRMTAAVSCKTILNGYPNSKDGMYWINPSGNDPKSNAMQVPCDMSSDGGGWVQLANIGETMRLQSLDKDTYMKGVGKASGPNAMSEGNEFVLPCDRFNGLDGEDGDLKSFVMRVTMGRVKDYFKPVTGASLCAVLTSNNKHLWSPNGGVNAPEEEAGANTTDVSGGEAEGEAAESEGSEDAEGAEGAEGAEAARFRERRSDDAEEDDEMMNTDVSDKEADEDIADAKAHEGAQKSGSLDEDVFIEMGERRVSGDRYIRRSRSGRRLLQSKDEDKEVVEEADKDAKAPMELTEQEKEKAIKFAENQVNSGWLTPVYMTNPALQEVVLGGCNKTWPTAMDGRSFISFWGGDKGGCCHEASNYYPDSNGAVDVGSWGRAFTIHITEVPPAPESGDTARFMEDGAELEDADDEEDDDRGDDDREDDDEEEDDDNEEER